MKLKQQKLDATTQSFLKTQNTLAFVRGRDVRGLTIGTLIVHEI